MKCGARSKKPGDNGTSKIPQGKVRLLRRLSGRNDGSRPWPTLLTADEYVSSVYSVKYASASERLTKDSKWCVHLSLNLKTLPIKSGKIKHSNTLQNTSHFPVQVYLAISDLLLHFTALWKIFYQAPQTISVCLLQRLQGLFYVLNLCSPPKKNYMFP